MLIHCSSLMVQNVQNINEESKIDSLKIELSICGNHQCKQKLNSKSYQTMIRSIKKQHWTSCKNLHKQICSKEAGTSVLGELVH